MDAALLPTDEPGETPTGGFPARRLGWLLSLVCRYRGILVLGLACTVAFACLHTVSIAVSFPVLKILLEEEGLRGWADRTVAGQRLGVAFAPLSDSDAARLITVQSDSALFRGGVRVDDGLRSSAGEPASDLLREVANVEPEATVTVHVLGAGDVAGALPRELSLTVAEAEWSLRMLRWAVSLLPPNADVEKLRTLVYLLVGLVLVVSLANTFRYFGEVLIAKAVLRAMMRLRTDLYERTLHLPMSFFSGRSTSDIVGRFVQDIQEIQRGMLTLVAKSIREPLRALFIMGLAFLLDWRITLVMTVVTPIAVLVFWRIGRSVKKSNRKLLQAYGSMIGALTTSLQSLAVVKAYTAEDRERERLLQVDQRVFKQQLKLAKLQAFVSPMIESIGVIAASCLMIWFASLVLDHGLSISKFGTLAVTLSVLFDPLRKLTDVYVRIQRALAGAERVMDVLNQPTETELGTPEVALQPLEKAIEFADVSYTYPGAEKPALRTVNLAIRKGETVAIVGPNGSGKTTLVSMLPRLFDPDDGEVRYDGIDIRKATLRSLRNQIGLVTQEAIVFAGTPIENIGYGQHPIDRPRAEDAARKASADEFIRGIPGGYDAALGERGTTLSGGERQRLAIARAIFRSAPILIFDEATSQVDSESELEIRVAIREFAKGRTTLIIAHRFSTIQFADRIIVMDAGRVVDTGTHRELFDRCSVYRALCETQFVSEPEPE